MNDLNRKTILIVEDEALIAMGEQADLEKHGYNVLIAFSGEDAVEVVDKTSGIDLILMDINLGKGIDGTEAALRILKTRVIPIVFLSSHTESEIVEKTEKITSYGYVVKHSGITVLDASIKMAFKLFDANKKVVENENRLDRAEKTAKIGNWALMLEPGIMIASKGASMIYGVEENQLSLEKIQKIPLPEYRPVLDNALDDLITKGIPYDLEFKILRPSDGSIVDIHSIAEYDKITNVVFGVIHEVTERTQAESRLRESEAKYHNIYENALEGIYRTSLEGNLLEANNAFAKMLGYDSPDEIIHTVTDAGKQIWLNPDERSHYSSLLQEKGVIREFDCQFRRKDGNMVWVSLNTKLVRDENGAMLFYEGFTMDITERKRVENALAREVFLMNAFMEHVPEAIYFKDRESRFIRINKVKTQKYGYLDPSEMVGKTDFDFFTEENARAKYEDEQTVMLTGQPISKEENEVWVDGPERWLLTTKMPLRDDAGNIMGTFGISKDITEHKLIEKKLHENEEKFRLMIKNSNDSFVLINEKGEQFYISDAAFRDTGFAVEELIGPISNVIYPEDLEIVLRAWDEVLSKKGNIVRVQYRHKHKYKEYIWYEAVAQNYIGNPLIGAVIVNVRDISAIKEAEIELIKAKERVEESEAKFRAIFESFGYSISVTRKGIQVSGNSAFKKLFGFKDDAEFLGRSLIENIAPEERDRIKKYILDRDMGRETPMRYETKGLRRDGTVFDVDIMISAYTLDNEQYIVGFQSDITEHKRMESALAREAFFMKAIMEYVPEYIYFKDLESRFIRVNFAQAQNFGFSDPQEMAGRTDFDFFTRENAQTKYADEQMVIKTGQSISKEEEELWTDKPKKWLLTTKMPLSDAEGNIIGTFGISKDITDRKNNETAIQKLLDEKELILQEVHHRIKNNMNTIKSVISLQAGSTKDLSSIRILKDAESRIQSMMILYEKLYQSASHNTVSAKDYFSSLVDDIVANFPNSRSVKIEKRIDDFVLDAKKMQPLGIIINELLTNIMKYAFIARTDGLITVSAALEGNVVSLLVGDNGNGMPESVNFQNSNGLGIKLVGMLSRQLGGCIRIERGNGTRIILEFEI